MFNKTVNDSFKRKTIKCMIKSVNKTVENSVSI